MQMRRAAGCVLGLLLAVGAAVSPMAPSVAFATQPRQTESVTVAELTDLVWANAKLGKAEMALEPFRAMGQTNVPGLDRVRASSSLLAENIAKREELRTEKIEKVRGELAEALAKPESPSNLSAALKAAVELQTLSTDKVAVVREPDIADLIRRAERAAKTAESRAEWLVANELFARLNILMEHDGRYKEDVRRMGYRLGMIRLFVPERLWDLRNQQRVAEGKDPLPAYNNLGEDYRDKLQGIEQEMVVTSILRAIVQHVDRDKVDGRDLLVGGLETLATFITTKDLHSVFPGLADEAARTRMLAWIDGRIGAIRQGHPPRSRTDVTNLLAELMQANRASVNLPTAAVLREFGDGAMSKLDEFSAIVWPDEVARFNRMTQGEFVGIGVQIQIEEASQMIKVVTPLEGTPAQRAGIRAGDLIKKIDGKPAVGIALTQAVDLITGPAGTRVTITMEREGQDVDFTLTRANIPLASVKGWRKTGPREDQWDWFIDPKSKIGYVRLTNFAPQTTNELEAAINQMKRQGLNGLILDMRFNPGGLLTQAVSVANLFIEHGTIVSTTGSMPGQVESARSGNTRLKGVPVAVLINEGSASASEIVAGALRHYADRGDIRAIVVGDNSYGKGSVQNVYNLSNTGSAMLKLTTQYYKLPNGQVIHRQPTSQKWGVQPHTRVEMLPEQIVDALTLRQDADVIMPDGQPRSRDPEKGPADPDRLITEGLDLQLQYALVLLQTQTVGPIEHARLGTNNGRSSVE